MTRLGGCLCGFVRYEATGTPRDSTNCHCTLCRRASGAPFVAWFTVSREDLYFTEGEPARFRSSEHAERCFCPRCGTPLAFASDRAPGDIDVTTSTLDRPESIPPRAECHVADKLAWAVLDPSLPAHRDGLP